MPSNERMLAYDSALSHPDSTVRQGLGHLRRGSGFISREAVRTRSPSPTPQNLKAKEPDMTKKRRILAMDATPVEEAVAQILAHLRDHMESDAVATAEGMLVALVEMCGRAEMATDAAGARAFHTMFPDAARIRHA